MSLLTSNMEHYLPYQVLQGADDRQTDIQKNRVIYRGYAPKKNKWLQDEEDNNNVSVKIEMTNTAVKIKARLNFLCIR